MAVSPRVDPRRLAHNALAAYRRGDFARAERLLERALERQPTEGSLAYFLGEARRAAGRDAAAVTAFEQAERCGYRDPELHLRKALALQRLGRPAEAELDLRACLALDPACAEALCNLANVRATGGALDEAIALYERAVATRPDLGPHVFANMAVLCSRAARWREACTYFETALGHHPDNLDLQREHARACKEAGDFDAAEQAFRALLEKAPGDTVARNNLANLLHDLGRFAEALELHAGLAAEHPDSSVHRFQLAIAEHAAERIDAALASFEAALELTATCESAASQGIEPTRGRIRMQRGMARLMSGALGAGWDDYEARWHYSANAPLERLSARGRAWNGEPLAGRRLFVFREQGIGDEIMFASCLPELLDAGADCVVQCDRRLAPAFRRSFPGARIVPASAAPEDWGAIAEEIGDEDYTVFAASLPRFLRRSLADFAPRGAYLRADRERVAHWRARLDALGPGLKLGVSWRGGTLENGGLFRSVPLARLARVLTLPGVVPVSVQYTDCGPEIAAWETATGQTLHVWKEALEDYDETLALLSALDAVVSVQTAVIHGCGALDVPTAVLLPRGHTNWRWFGHGPDAHWYRSLRLMHQRRERDWTEVVEDARAWLGGLMGRGS